MVAEFPEFPVVGSRLPPSGNPALGILDQLEGRISMGPLHGSMAPWPAKLDRITTTEYYTTGLLAQLLLLLLLCRY